MAVVALNYFLTYQNTYWHIKTLIDLSKYLLTYQNTYWHILIDFKSVKQDHMIILSLSGLDSEDEYSGKKMLP